MADHQNRYRTLAGHMRRRFGRRVQKIPLDAGYSCPNRDGTVCTKGCTFCNSRGSGTGLWASGASLEQQWEHWRARLAKRYKACAFIAYLQAHSNTHGPAGRLAQVLEQLRGLPQLVGVSVATRPDCVDQEKLDILASFQPGFENAEVWLELGLQSANDATLRRINRGHDAACFAGAAHMAEEAARRAGRTMPLCAHVVAGLPGEGEAELLATVDFVNSLPVAGIKFHNLYVCEGSTLADEWRSGRYQPPAMEDYVAWLAAAIARLRPDTVVHRLTGDAAPGELLAPAWAGRKNELLAAVRTRLENDDIRQGQTFHKQPKHTA